MTSTDHLLALIRDTPDVADLLHSSFEFGIFRIEHGEAVRTASGASLDGLTVPSCRRSSVTSTPRHEPSSPLTR
ncbi:hypothetical protein [Streptomyces wuyuanensis]|uniref:hypothetical protein n=1 Tax=Streptomyces wuyuanensis TaxID=1196353 RepID=UPI0037120485